MRKILPDSVTLSKIKCPICGSDFEIKNDSSLLCNGQKRHCYDFSASGYVNFMPPGSTDGGDSKEAVAARRNFLSKNYYRPCADALAATLRKYVAPESVLIDAGCGEGYYLSLVAKDGYSVSGIDISKSAVQAASKLMGATGVPNGFFAVGSVFDLPFVDSSADAVINVFAPCSEKEFSRVLRQDGILAVVYAGPDHLMGLKQALYTETHQNDGRADMPEGMELIEEVRVRFDITVEGQENIQNLFSMTPYYWRTSKTDSEKLKAIESLKTPVDMIIAVYKNK